MRGMDQCNLYSTYLTYKNVNMFNSVMEFVKIRIKFILNNLWNICKVVVSCSAKTCSYNQTSSVCVTHHYLLVGYHLLNLFAFFLICKMEIVIESTLQCWED